MRRCPRAPADKLGNPARLRAAMSLTTRCPSATTVQSALCADHHTPETQPCIVAHLVRQWSFQNVAISRKYPNGWKTFVRICSRSTDAIRLNNKCQQTFYCRTGTYLLSDSSQASKSSTFGKACSVNVSLSNKLLLKR